MVLLPEYESQSLQERVNRVKFWTDSLGHICLGQVGSQKSVYIYVIMFIKTVHYTRRSISVHCKNCTPELRIQNSNFVLAIFWEAVAKPGLGLEERFFFGREEINRNKKDGKIWIPEPVTDSKKLGVHYTTYFSEVVMDLEIHILPSFLFLFICSLPRTGR